MKKRVLFLCNHNACRSQMAEGYLRHFAGDRAEAYSAGIESTSVDPRAVAVMGELGIDISRQKSKSTDEFIGHTFDFIITVCDEAEARCPFFPGDAVRIHWSIREPARVEGEDEQQMREYRKVRDEIVERIDEFSSTSL